MCYHHSIRNLVSNNPETVELAFLNKSAWEIDILYDWYGIAETIQSFQNMLTISALVKYLIFSCFDFPFSSHSLRLHKHTPCLMTILHFIMT